MRPRFPSPHHVVRRRVAGLAAAVLAVSLGPAQATSRPSAQTVTVAAQQPVYRAAEGGQAAVAVVVTTSDGSPLAAPASVRYATGSGTATAGVDFPVTDGTLTFPAGSASGSAQRFTLAVPRDGAAETAETVPVSLRAAAGATVTRQPVVIIDANGLPYLDAGLGVERRVADLLGRMSLADKIGQMTQAERAAVAKDPSLVAQWRLGSVLSGGGSVPTPNTPAAWVQLVNTLQSYALSTPLQIPMIYGIDAVHGHGNVSGATIFPHNVGLGASRDPALVQDVYHATAAEVRATGIPWNFAPCLCVSRDERWGRAYESFAEDPALVARMATAVDGLQGPGRSRLAAPDGVLATAKHYAGDGDTEYGTGSGNYTIDQGVTVTDRADFARVDLAPFRAAVREHGVGSVMPSFSSVDWTADGVGNPVKMHANRELITGVLKRDIGLDGFLVSDWEAIHQLPDPAAPAGEPKPTAGQVRAGVNAGTDMFMEPHTAARFQQLLRDEVTAGRVSTARIDDAVRRILRAKFALGLFEHPYAPADRLGEVGSAAHRALARRAAAQSQVLLKNRGHALPLRPDARIYLAGRTADDIGNQAGGWTLDWQGRSGAAFAGTTILAGIREVAPRATVTFSADASAPTAGADIGVVVVGETPYAEGYGDVGGPACTWCTPPQAEPKSLSLQPGDRAVVDKVCAALPTCVVLLVSGRPQLVTDQLGDIDALVASWLPGGEGAGVADVLFGRRPFTGRLPMTWPRTADQVPINVGDTDYRPLFPYGWGLRTDPGRDRVASAGGANPAPTLAALLAPGRWQPDATLRADADTVDVARRALTAPGTTAAGRDAVLSVLRDAAQARAEAGGAPPRWAALIADADHAEATGAPGRSGALLAQVITG
ncbi:beta-glucosidase [Krasilnikovia cinnamomea]|uniref:beta-glucosidase n=1 Tax=Krasilnikovia cinnamomea TaxID=349313 RepID=A0A4Q7ZUV5_9ACTN|nr:glycoside hydrolase family 3 N-terminal domain-containing protein [Krasilnikovia cinnamomea]RZU54423.1 beta-glucosidase [Krasilnikovia cinnamomea]